MSRLPRVIVKPLDPDRDAGLTVLQRCLAGCGHYWPPAMLDERGECPECGGLNWIEASYVSAVQHDHEPEPEPQVEAFFGPLFGVRP